MADCFIVFAGGSGSMVLESLVHMSALSVMGFEHIHALMLDVDNGNGNLARATDALQVYSQFRRSMGNTPLTGFFETDITLYRWTPFQLDTIHNSTLRGMIADDDDAVWLARALFTEDEINHEVPVGFKGHPNIGVVFLQNLLRNNVADESISAFVNAFVCSPERKMMLVGSCFGGTGAATIPVFSQCLRDRITKERGKTFELALLAVEPYFNLPRSTDASLQIDSEVFDDKVKTVLSYYTGALFKDNGGQALYQHLFLLGSSNRIWFPNNSSGKNTQVNPANFITWFACAAIKQFYHTQYSDTVATKNGRLHLAWLKDSVWSWDQFSVRVFPTLEKKSAQMMQLAMLYICKLHNDVQALPNVTRYGFPYNLLITLDAAKRKEVQTHSRDFTTYLALFINWCFQIMTHLPFDAAAGAQENNDAAAQGDAEFAGFHHVDLGDIEKVYAEKHVIANDYDRSMLYSLVHQMFFDAFLLCKLESKRMEYWPFEDEQRQINDAAVLLGQNGRRAHAVDDLTIQPFVNMLNKITKSDFLGENVTVEMLMAYVKDKAPVESQDPALIYRSLINSMFDAVEIYQK